MLSHAVCSRDRSNLPMNDQFNTKADAAATKAKPADPSRTCASASSGSAMSGCRSRSTWRGTSPWSASTSTGAASASSQARRPYPRGHRRGVCRGPKPFLLRRYRGARRLQFLHRHRADADRPGQAPGSSALIAASRDGRQRALASRMSWSMKSTVYPGVTEEVCAPILAQASGLKLNQDFFVGYSPERINPGDHAHRLPDIIKVTSGSTPEAADLVDFVYGTRGHGGHAQSVSRSVSPKPPRSSRTSSATSTSRSSTNSPCCSSSSVSKPARCWRPPAPNGTSSRSGPGLVGGHCIGVDPYYLTHKAESIGFHPEMILAGRRINDGMASYVAGDVVKTMLKRKQRVGRRPRPGHGLHVQGELPRHPQHQGRRPGAGAWRLRRGRGLRSGRRPRRRAA